MAQGLRFGSTLSSQQIITPAVAASLAEFCKRRGYSARYKPDSMHKALHIVSKDNRQRIIGERSKRGVTIGFHGGTEALYDEFLRSQGGGSKQKATPEPDIVPQSLPEHAPMKLSVSKSNTSLAFSFYLTNDDCRILFGDRDPLHCRVVVSGDLDRGIVLQRTDDGYKVNKTASSPNHPYFIKVACSFLTPMADTIRAVPLAPYRHYQLFPDRGRIEITDFPPIFYNRRLHAKPAPQAAQEPARQPPPRNPCMAAKPARQGGVPIISSGLDALKRDHATGTTDWWEEVKAAKDLFNGLMDQAPDNCEVSLGDDNHLRIKLLLEA